MKRFLSLFNPITGESGVSAVLVALLLLFVIVGMAALAIDVGHLYVVKNQLQSAADAGALAGARVLYTEEGEINTGVDGIARDTARENFAEREQVEVNLPGDVERGHWSFDTRKFTPNDSTELLNILGKTFTELDTNTDFINAVRVTTRREASPAALFFARIFALADTSRDWTSVGINARAIAYRSTAPQITFSMPIAICRQAITDSDGNYSCNVGRMINSGNDAGGGSDGQSGGWTNFSQQPTCSAANASDVKAISDQTTLCGGKGINQPLNIFEGVGTSNGMETGAFNLFYDCWQNNASLKTDPSLEYPNKPAKLVLPVIECDQNGRIISTCSQVVGAIEVYVIWITDNTNDPQYKIVPTEMRTETGDADWSCETPKPSNEVERKACWNSFVDHFHVSNLAQKDGTYEKPAKAIFFKPACTPGTVDGTGGYSFFRIPKLVE